jgi:hypothetical protein
VVSGSDVIRTRDGRDCRSRRREGFEAIVQRQMR